MPPRSLATLLALVPLGAPARTLPVGGAPDAVVPDDFPTVAGAVAGAVDVDGDGTTFVLVRAGTWRAGLVVARSDLRVEGEDRATTRLVGRGAAPVVTVAGAARVCLRELTLVAGAGGGVALKDVLACCVERCVVEGGAWGVALEDARLSVVGATTVVRPRGAGLRVARSTACTLARNRVAAPGGAGIVVEGARRSLLVGNVVHGAGGDGIVLRGVRDARLRANGAVACAGAGLKADQARELELRDNLVQHGGESGLVLRATTSALVHGNRLLENAGLGIELDGAQADFDADRPGMQPPPGANRVAGNGRGPVGGR